MGRDKGNCTWGVGTLAHYGVCSDEELNRKVTKEQVDTVLAQHVHNLERYIKRKVSHHPLSQEQFDALISFCYNVNNPVSVLSDADTGRFSAVHNKILQFVYVFDHDSRGQKIGKPKFVHGLYNRRLGEAQSFR